MVPDTSYVGLRFLHTNTNRKLYFYQLPSLRFLPKLGRQVLFCETSSKAPPEENARRHAIGTHFNHKFLLIPKSYSLKNAEFVNVDTIWQTAHINSTVPGGDQYTSWSQYGKPHGTTNANTFRAHTGWLIVTRICYFIQSSVTKTQFFDKFSSFQKMANSLQE